MTLSREDLLIVLIEEAGEVIQAATKCLRFGWGRNHPNYGVNYEVLSKEVGDFIGIVRALPLQQHTVDFYADHKIAKVEAFAASAATETR